MCIIEQEGSYASLTLGVRPGCALEMRVHSGYAANANCGLVSIITLSWCPERRGRSTIVPDVT